MSGSTELNRKELISAKTRIGFRDYLSSEHVLRDIREAFDAGEIDRDDTWQPYVSGERRTLIEQYYKTLDFRSPSDVRKFLGVFEGTY